MPDAELWAGSCSGHLAVRGKGAPGPLGRFPHLCGNSSWGLSPAPGHLTSPCQGSLLLWPQFPILTMKELDCKVPLSF